MRTTLFIARGGTDRKPEPGERFIGREAINRFTQANVGRTIEYAWQDFGKTELLDGNGAVIFQSIGALIDQNIPGRLFQSLKSHLRDSDFVDTNVFGTPYRIEELIAIVLRMIVDRIEVILGNSVTRMVIGRPVHYSHNPDHDQIAIDRMREACQLAALPQFAFLPEPNAAAVAICPHGRRPDWPWCLTLVVVPSTLRLSKQTAKGAVASSATMVCPSVVT
jgi:hypothetical chaperone protein